MNTVRRKFLKVLGYKVVIDLREMQNNSEYLYSLVAPSYREKISFQVNLCILGMLLVSLFVNTVSFSSFLAHAKKYTFPAQAHNDFTKLPVSIQNSRSFESNPVAFTADEKNETVLISNIEQILGSDAEKYGIYIKDMKHKVEFGIHDDKVFPSASIYKVPLAMLILKDIDDKKLSFEEKLPIKSMYKVYSTDILYFRANNTALTIQEYLYYLIVESDNVAMLALESMLGGTTVINNRFRTELGITNFFREPMTATAQEVGSVFKKLYNQSFLTRATNDYLLNLLLTTDPNFQTRIPALIPNDGSVKIAHKVGQIRNGNLWTYADAGIIFSDVNDFILVVLNKDITVQSGEEKISKIAQLSYEYLN